MAAREQTGDRELYRLVLAYYDFTNLCRESLNLIRHSGMVCGNNAFRKHDVGGKSIRPVTFAGALVSSLNPINQVFLQILAVCLPASVTRARASCFARMSLNGGRGGMRIAVTFRDQPEHKRRGHEQSHSSLNRGEAESLPHFVELETMALLSHELLCAMS